MGFDTQQLIYEILFFLILFVVGPKTLKKNVNDI